MRSIFTDLSLANESDLELLRGCFGAQDCSPASEVWIILRKRGSILSMCPQHLSSALSKSGFRGFRFRGRLIEALVSLCVSSPLGRFLPQRILYRSKSCLINRLETRFTGCVETLLFGNPSQSHRRAIIRLRQENGKHLAIKAGFSPQAISSIKREAEFLDRENVVGVHVPRVIDQSVDSREGWFASEWVDGCHLQASTSSYEKLVEFLRSLLIGQKTQLADILAKSRSASLVADLSPRLAELPIEETISHGDFARWNLLDLGGSISAIDWELGSPHGLAGCDLVHFFWQDLRLIHDLSIDKALIRLRQQLKQAPMSDFLYGCGWETIDQAVALYFATLPSDFERLPRTILEGLFAGDIRNSPKRQ